MPATTPVVAAARACALTAFSHAAALALALAPALAPRAPAQTTTPAPTPPTVVSLGPGYIVSAPTYVVTSTRTPELPTALTDTVHVLPGDTLRTAPTLTLDGELRTIPGFTLFRRSDSLTANPTAQGVSLRGLGPSGASRSLILLDGVPLNDPFGGWVSWTLVPRVALDRAELVPGGGATAWGNASLGGVVQLFTTDPGRHSQPSLRFDATVGDYGTRALEFAASTPADEGWVQLLGDDFSTAGFSLVAPERRGSIDIGAWSRHHALTARVHEPLAAFRDFDFTITARTYQEYRGNGTPYTQNSSRENFVSLDLNSQPSDSFAWHAVGYAQDQKFTSTFSSVNATRTAETPASNQYDVPATAWGGAWTGSWKHDDGGRTSAGFDARAIRGETREYFTFASGNYTRQRIAGGDQAFEGLFVLHEQPLVTDLRALIGARLDHWTETDGHRRETDRTTGAILRDDHYAGKDGNEFSPTAGLVWRLGNEWRLRATAQHAFRVPTLNELYRPFRQGTNVIETNADLRTEHDTSAEVSAEFHPTMVNGHPTLTTTAFWNDLRDAVGNVSIAHGPGTFPLFGTLPAGGVGRQRLNVDRTLVQGLEFSASWELTQQLTVTGELLLSDATVRTAAVNPALVGNRVAQDPKHSASLSAAWKAPLGFAVTPRLRWIGRQFEDDENTLILGEVLILDLGLSHRLTRGLDLFLNVENLGNARIETGRSADGTVNTGTPRLLTAGLRGTW